VIDLQTLAVSFGVQLRSLEFGGLPYVAGAGLGECFEPVVE
jgi:hypothetical protein